MRQSTNCAFLVLQFDPREISSRISIAADLADAVEAWSASTRVSPIWPVGFGSGSTPTEFPADHDLIFVGPAAPGTIAADLGELRTPGVRIWVTAGVFNNLISIPCAPPLSDIRSTVCAWAKSHGVPYEIWDVRNNIVTSFEFFANSTETSASLAHLGQSARESIPEGLGTPLQEYHTLMATSLTRAAATSRVLFDDLNAINAEILETLRDARENRLPAIDAQAHLLSVNAALSRYSSQAFSGTSPIRGTECHFWIHSLLGVGVANLALSRLTSFIQGVLGEARLPERLLALASVKSNVPTLGELTGTDRHSEFDIVTLSGQADTSEAVTPLLTYFSGRDGFSSHLQTISAPLTTISECNSYRYNLLTITHELTHIFIHGILPILYPSFDDQDEIASALELLAPRAKPGHLLDAARQLLLESVVSMETAATGREFSPEDLKDQLSIILRRRRREAQEIMVHTFDYMYFYSRDTKFYVAGIWQSWSAIPGIADRVREYVMRCLCAISSSSLTHDPEVSFRAALREVEEVLKELDSGRTLMSHYVADGLTYIREVQQDSDAYDRALQSYTARMGLTRLVAIFLHSETLSAKLFSDSHITSGPKSYPISHLEHGVEKVGNPLRFLRENLKENPSPSESLWVLHHLAFNEG